MNQAQFISKVEDTFQEALKILYEKNSDYAEDNDPFKNFRFAKIINVGVEKAILVRIADKLARISNLIHQGNNNGAVKDESIFDTLVDLANYAAILKVYLENKGKDDIVES